MLECDEKVARDGDVCPVVENYGRRVLGLAPDIRKRHVLPSVIYGLMAFFVLEALVLESAQYAVLAIAVL